MVQLGLDLPLPVRGFFTLEEHLLDHSLSEMENLLGYSKGRLKQGADIFILQPPTHTYDFDRMGTSVFPGHRFGGSNLYHAINGEEKKEHDMKLFQRKRLVKVVPLMIHLEAMRRFLTEKEYFLLKDTHVPGKTAKEIMAEWKKTFAKNPTMLAKIERDFARSKEIYQRQNINDELYPMASGSGVPQWELKTTVLARCECRLTDYTGDRYQRVF